MKKLIINCLATTGLTLIILAGIASLYQAKFLFVSSVYQSFLVNILIHLGLLLVQKFESKYFLLEVIVEISFIFGLLVTFGFLFKWYNSTPLWIVLLMGIVIYLLGCLINIIKINDDISYINNQLKLLNAKKSQ